MGKNGIKKLSSKKQKKTKSKKEEVEIQNDDDFGGITIIKSGTALASLLLSQSSNGMSTGPIY